MNTYAHISSPYGKLYVIASTSVPKKNCDTCARSVTCPLGQSSIESMILNWFTYSSFTILLLVLTNQEKYEEDDCNAASH
jgi:hypothetical protein